MKNFYSPHKTWSRNHFSLVFGGVGIGVAMWTALAVMNAFIVLCLPNVWISSSVFIVLFAFGYSLTWIKDKQGIMQKLIDKHLDEILEGSHRYALYRAFICMIFMLVLTHILRLAVYHAGIVPWNSFVIASVLFFGIFYAWQLLAVYTVKHFCGYQVNHKSIFKLA